ncbi:MAG: ABC transporter substrate-binding protein [Methanomassiliicoccales archaeon]|nr:ABC transporter substrate-binding protein [Methanomassiliicoccales archaeon]
MQNVYETMMFYEGASASVLVPQLCTSVPTVANGGITDDGYTYTYNLRTNVTFHDGTDMTADDVVYSFVRALRYNYQSGATWMVGELAIPWYYNYTEATFGNDGNINNTAVLNLANGTVITPGTISLDTIAEHIWAKDDYTVQFNLTVPFPGWNYVITYTIGDVISKDFVEANGGLTKDGYDYMATHMCGTGPFSLGEFIADDHFLLLKNNDYYMTPAKLDQVLIRQVPEASTRLLELQSGDADVAAIPRTMETSVNNRTDIRIVKGLGTFSVDFIGLNMDINPNSTLMSHTNVPLDFFANKNVRLAFAHAMNVSKLIATAYNGAGIQENGAIPMGMFGYDASTPTYDFDLALVKSYLENATYTDPDTNETWNWLDHGFSLDIFYNSGNTVRQTACELFKDGLEAASDNIHIYATELEWSVFLNARRHGMLPVLFLGWAPDYADPNDYMQPFFVGTYADTVGYHNVTVNAEIAAAAAEQNPTARANMYSNISYEMYKECVFVWTVQATNFHCERTTVTGYVFNPMYSGLYYYPMDKA